ncbi:MAG: hypothetical protein KJ685_02665, partial [Nanoarchaeota archaeon]|nr:hypothetical protein [Nanoarchaeota archaeon]
DATYTFKAHINDSVGTMNSTSITNITLDTVAPVVSPSSPANNLWTTDTTPDFVFNVVDSIATDLNCSLWVDGSRTAINESTNNDTSTTLTSTDLSEATHTWFVNCSDNASNWNWTTTRTLNVDNTAPLVALNYPLEDNYTFDTTPTYNFTCNDSIDLVINASLIINGSLYGDNASCQNATYCIITANDTLTENENYNWSVKCWDEALNTVYSVGRNMSVVSGGNNPPTVDTVTSVANQDPNPEIVKAVLINFTVTDTDGTTDLNHSSAKVTVNQSGITRTGTCSNNTIDSDTEEYNCTVSLQHYDLPGAWSINVSIRDNSEASAYNATTVFSYNELLYIQVSPVAFGFGDFYSGQQDQPADSNPLQIDNLGNVNLTQINITAYNLINDSNTIDVSNIVVNISDSASGTALQHATNVTIPFANISMDTAGGEINESLYFYIDVPFVRPLYYQSSSSWVISAGN